MEYNKSKLKKKSLISLFACMIVAVCILFAGCGKETQNSGTDKDATTQKQEIVFEKNEAGEILAKDEETLRAALADEATYTISITEDICIRKPLTVKGTKTLVGDKSITMDLNTQAKQRVCSVSADAYLILDGPTIDGNGVSSGIEVKSGGKLDCLSGNIVYPMPYGIVTAGTVNVENITINRSMHTGIYVETGGELYMKGGQITNCIQTGIATSTKAYAKVSNDTVIRKSSGSLFYNYGTLDIVGGTFSESYSNCIYNKGELNIVSESEKKVEFFDSGRSVISSVAGTTVTINGLYVHDIAAHVMNLEKDSVAVVENCLVDNTGKSAFYASGSKLTLKDVESQNAKSVGINITNKSTAEMQNITISNGAYRGIVNDTSTVTMKNITVDNLVGAGIITIGEKSVTTIENAKISKVGKSGIGITGGTVTAKNIEITDAAGTGIYTTTASSKTTIDGAKIVNSGKSAIGVSVGTLKASNVEIDGTVNSGIYVQKDATGEFTGVTLKNVEVHGIANYGGKMVLEKATIVEPKRVAIANDAGTLEGTTIVIEKTGSRAINLINGSTTKLTGLTIKEAGDQAIYVDGCALVRVTDFTIDTTKQTAIRVTNSKDVLIKNGKITGTKGDGVYVAEAAAIKVQDVVIEKPAKHGLEAVGAEITAINVTIDAPTRAGIVNNGGTVNGNNIKIHDSGSRSVSLINKSTTSITGLTVTNAGDQAVYIDDTTKVVLKEIDIDKTKNAAIRVAASKDVVIKKGSIQNAGSDSIYTENDAKIKVEEVAIKNATNYALNCVSSEITANNIDIQNAKCGIVNKSGVINGSTISIDTTTSRALNLVNGGITKIAGLTIKNVGDQAIWVDTSTVDISKFTVDTTTSAAIRVANSENVSFKNGTMKNVGGDGIYVGDASKVYVGTVDIIEATKYGIECVESEVTADGVNIKNVIAGIVNNGGTFNGTTVAINDTTSRAINLISGSETDITGLTIKNAGDQGVYVEDSIATISDFTVDTTVSSAISLGVPEETDAGSSEENVVTIVTLNNGTIKAAGSDAVYVEATTVANLTGVTIENAKRHGIYNHGGKLNGTDVTINQSTNRAVSMSTDSETTMNGLYITGTGDQAVYIDGGKAEISGFEISGSASAAVRIFRTKDVKLTGGTINAASYGIAISDEASAIAEDVRIYRCQGNSTELVNDFEGAELTLQNGENTQTDKQSLIDGQGYDGRGVVVEGIFTLNGGTIQNNNTAVEGAGVYVKADGSLIMNGGIIGNNVNTKEGAGVYIVEGGSFVMNNGYIQHNQTDDNSAGVAVRGSFTLNGGTIQNNTAGKNGAGVMVRSTATFAMSGGTIKNNTSTLNGGGIYIQTSTADVNITGGTIENNHATNGGGIYMNSSMVVHMKDATITANTASEKGAGVYIAKGTVDLAGGSIANHGTAESPSQAEGAGVYVASGAKLSMTGGTISNNYTTKNGAGVATYGTFNMSQTSTIQNNTTTANGGAVYVGAGTYTLNNGAEQTIYNNQANNGGGVAVVGTFHLKKGTFANNNATVSGNDIYQAGTLKLTQKLTKDIFISPATYAEGTVVAVKGDLSDADFASSMKFVKVKNYDSTYWVVNDSGVLTKASMGILSTGLGYASITEAIAAAGEEDTIIALQDQEIGTTIEVTKKVNLTCLEAVTITASDDLSGNMFDVASGSTLSINGVAEGTEITLTGGSATTNVINNSGTLLLDNVKFNAGTNAIYDNGGTVGTTEKPLHNINISDAAKYGIYSNGGTVNIDGITVTGAVSGIFVDTSPNANVTVSNANILDAKANAESIGLVVKGGTATLKNVIINNVGLEDATVRMRGIYVENSQLNLDNVKIQNLVSTAANCHGIHLGAGTELIVTNNEVDTDNSKPGLSINNVGGHGIVVTNDATMNISKLLVQSAGRSAICVQKTGANGVFVNNANLKDSGENGLLIQGGTVTLKNTVIDNSGITDTSADRIGIKAEAGTLNLDNVTVQNFVSTKESHGIYLTGSQLNVTANETVDGGNKGLYIFNVKGHGLYATKGGMNIDKLSIDGNSKTIRAGIRIYAEATMTNTITDVSIAGCNADVQIKNTSLTILGVTLTATTTQVQKTIAEIIAMQ